METFFGQVHFPTPRHCHFWKEVLVFVYICPLHWPLPFLVIYDMGINWKLILSTFPWYIWWDHLMASSAVAFFENIVLPFLEGGWGVCECYEMGIQVPNKESKLGCHFWKVVRVFVHALTHISLFGKSLPDANFIEISTDWFSGSNFLKRKCLHNFRVNQLRSLGQWLSKCGCLTVFGAHFIKISTDWFSGSKFQKRKVIM